MSQRAFLSARVFQASAIAAAVLAMPLSAVAQTTVVINEPTRQVDDARIQGGSLANTVFHQEPLATKVHPSSDTYHRRTLLKFDTHNTIPSGATVQSATLTLTVSRSDPETRRLGLYRLSQTFDERYASWSTRKSGTRWSRAGGDIDQRVAEASVGTSVGARVQFDITALVQGVVRGTYGSSRYTRLALMDLGSGSNTSYKEFYNSEVSDASRRPTLTVVYGGSSSTSTSSGSTSGDTSGSTAASGSTSTGSMPSGWQSRDIGSVGVYGSASGSSSSMTVSGGGADVWGTADAFHFAYRTLTGDGTITAQVSSITGREAWTKVGVMFRGSTSAGAPQAFMLVSASKGLAFQRRASSGGTSAHTSGGSGTAPRWVRLARAGSTVTAYASTDGRSWTRVGSATVNLPSTALVGLAVSSHDTGRLATGVFQNVSVTAGTPTTTTTAPAPSTSTSSSSSSTLRVLHWNTHYGVGTDGRYDIDRIATWIARFNPDLISLNEVTRYAYYNSSEDQAARYAALLRSKTGRTWYHYYRVDSGSSRGVGNIVLSRFPIASTSYCQLSSRRVAVNATVHVNGRSINFWSTHLDSSSSNSGRVAEVRNLTSCIRNFAEQRIVGGDFNAQASSTEIGIMEGDYDDAWARAASMGAAVDYAGNSRFGATRNTRIDYVFHSERAGSLVLRRAQVFDTRDSRGYMPSDHKPLLVTYEVR